MLVVGEKEMNEGMVSVRKHGEGDKGAVTQDTFIHDLLKLINEHTRKL